MKKTRAQKAYEAYASFSEGKLIPYSSLSQVEKQKWEKVAKATEIRKVEYIPRRDTSIYSEERPGAYRGVRCEPGGIGER